MQYYVIRRLLLLPVTVLGVTLVTFFMLHLVPGDFVDVMTQDLSGYRLEQVKASLREHYGLDKPVLVQYLTWIGNMFSGEFGVSLIDSRPVTEEFSKRILPTAEIALMAFVLAIAIGVPMGVASAVWQDKWPDYLIRLVSIAGLSTPIFFSGVIVLVILVNIFNWLPPFRYTSLFEDPVSNLEQLVWPALITGYYISAPLMRLTRSQMLEVLRGDYIRTARSKGLSEKVVIYRHAIRNALLPIITVAGLTLGRLLGGLVVAEKVFNIPGMGTGLVTAVTQRDYPVVQFFVLFFAVTFLILNLVVDLLYGWVDPRVRYA